jgi:predicted dehydrogenase
MVGAGSILQSCSRDGLKNTKPLNFLDSAIDGRKLKLGLIGCGSRGTGAISNFLNSGPGIEVIALADVFEDKLIRCRRELSGKMNISIPDENCFIGFDAYQKLLDTDVDLVVLATPPFFRPEHFDAAVTAKKHVFMEKPVAVDPVGARSIIASAKRADFADLKVGVGTQRRHQRDYLSTLEHIRQGAIGEILSANCYWNQGALWHVKPQIGWSEMEGMLRNWVNWCWLSGDHIVEQHLHNIDVINWFTGKLPERALGFGSRQRRKTGDQYDNFSVDLSYDDGMHTHSMCRQIDGCANNVSELIVGTKGVTNCKNTIWDHKNNIKWKYDYEKEETGAPPESEILKVGPYDQETIDLVTAIRNNAPYNEAEESARSALVAIMGRVSAYTGNEISFEEIINSDLKLGPSEMILGEVNFRANVPVPGI